MSEKLIAAQVELDCVKLEINNLKDAIADPAISSMVKQRCELRLIILQFGFVMLTNAIEEETREVDISSLLELGDSSL